MWDGAAGGVQQENMHGALGNPTTTTTYTEKKPMPDDEALVVQRNAEPSIDANAKAGAEMLGSDPAASIEKMLELSSHVRLGLAYKQALGKEGVVPKLAALLKGEEVLAKASCELLYSLARHGPNAEELVSVGAVPLLITRFEKFPEFHVCMGGVAAGALKRIAATSPALQARVVKAGGMEALLIGYRNYPINDDVEESVPANATRIAILKQVSEFEEEQLAQSA